MGQANYNREKILEAMPDRIAYHMEKSTLATEELGKYLPEGKERFFKGLVQDHEEAIQELEDIQNALQHASDSTATLSFREANLIFPCQPD